MHIYCRHNTTGIQRPALLHVFAGVRRTPYTTPVYKIAIKSQLRSKRLLALKQHGASLNRSWANFYRFSVLHKENISERVSDVVNIFQMKKPFIWIYSVFLVRPILALR